MTIREYLENRKYPGRMIITGSTEDGRSVIAYALMGRSENSRNRVLVYDRDANVLKTAPFDGTRIEKSEYVIYTAMRSAGNRVIVSNGNQSDLIYDELSADRSLEDAVIKMTYEDDEPVWTSRISAVYDEETHSCQMAVVRKEGDSTARVIYTYPEQKGYAHCIHTYLETDTDMLPPFTKDPERVCIGDTISQIASEIWEALDRDNRISLFVQVGDEVTVINRNEEEESGNAEA